MTILVTKVFFSVLSKQLSKSIIFRSWTSQAWVHSCHFLPLSLGAVQTRKTPSIYFMVNSNNYQLSPLVDHSVGYQDSI